MGTSLELLFFLLVISILLALSCMVMEIALYCIKKKHTVFLLAAATGNYILTAFPCFMWLGFFAAFFLLPVLALFHVVFGVLYIQRHAKHGLNRGDYIK